MKELIENYENACKQLSEAFAEKQDLKYIGFVGSNTFTPEISVFEDGKKERWLFQITDIFFDIKESLPNGLIIKWVSYVHDKIMQDKQYMNYETFAHLNKDSYRDSG